MRGAIIGLATLAAVGGCTRAVAVAKGREPVIAGTLQGGPWLVEDLNGGGIVDNARVDLTFDPGDDGDNSGPGTGVVTGRSGCNRYRGAWKQQGATIRLGPLASTMMACPPALMQLEQKFLNTLEAVSMVTYRADGSALLKAPDGRTIRIRREQP